MAVNTQQVMPKTSYQNSNVSESYAKQKQNLDLATKFAMPSQQSMDNAAARVRSRLAGREKATSQQIGDQFAGRGVSNSGLQDSAQRFNRDSTTNEMAKAYTDLESDFWDKQQEGSKILSDIGSIWQNAGKTYGDLDQNFQKLNNDYFIDSGNLDAKNREIDASIEKIRNDYEIGREGNRIDEKKGDQDIASNIARLILEGGNTQLTPGAKAILDAVLNNNFSSIGVTYPSAGFSSAGGGAAIASGGGGGGATTTANAGGGGTSGGGGNGSSGGYGQITLGGQIAVPPGEPVFSVSDPSTFPAWVWSGLSNFGITPQIYNPGTHGQIVSGIATSYYGGGASYGGSGGGGRITFDNER